MSNDNPRKIGSDIRTMQARTVRGRNAALGAVRAAWATNPLLTALGVLMVLVLAGTMTGLVVDRREITGAPAWMKPAKFALSITIYSFTLVWLLSFFEGRRRLVWLAGGITAVALFGEMVLIVLQVVRDTTSHFNTTTSFNSLVFIMMGLLIILVWVAGLVVAVMLLRQRRLNSVFGWGLRLGMVISVVGMGVAVLMTEANPSHAENARDLARAAGLSADISGAHSVGVADGGPGLPVVGWSTKGGDLRVPHFVGLHGLQVLAAVGWLLSRYPRRAGKGHRLALLWTVSAAYLGLVLLLTWQALRGQPLVKPDVATVMALTLLAGGTALTAAAIVLRARACCPRSQSERRLTSGPTRT